MSVWRSTVRQIQDQGPRLMLGRPLHDGADLDEAPCFIVGSGRCGSTLLRVILTTNPEIHIPPETYVLGGIIQEYRLLSRLPWSFVVRNVLSRLEYQPNFDMFEISLRDLYKELVSVPHQKRTLSYILHSFYMYHAARYRPTATRWGDKTPGNVSCLMELKRVFPNMKVIHMIRDGRDVVRSFLKMEGRMGLEEATDRWLTSINQGRHFGERYPEHYREIYYEELVERTESEIRKVCEFIALDFQEEMLHHYEVRNDSPDIARYPHYQNVMKPISVNFVGRWRKDLDRDAMSLLDRRMGYMLRELGYS